MTIDVITVVSDTTKKGWVNQCLRSVESASQNSDLVRRHIISPGVTGNIGLAFKNSLITSTSDYVCWVDDDDFILPNAFTCVEHHFRDSPAAIFAREIHLYANGHISIGQETRRHHLTIYRRDVIDQMPLEDYPKFTTQSKINYVEQNFPYLLVDELSWIYVYRKYNSAGFYVRQDHAIPKDVGWSPK